MTAVHKHVATLNVDRTDAKKVMLHHVLCSGGNVLVPFRCDVPGIAFPFDVSSQVWMSLHIRNDVIVVIGDDALEVRSFGHDPTPVRLPWAAIFALSKAGGWLTVWSSDAPHDIEQELYETVQEWMLQEQEDGFAAGSEDL